MNIDTRESNNSTRRSRMGVGIHEGCTVDRVEIRTPKEKSLLEVWILNSAGDEQKATIWIPDLNKPYIKSGESTQEAVTREVNEFRDKTAEVLRALFNDERQHLAGNLASYPQMFMNRVNEGIAAGNKVDVVVQWTSDEQHTEFPSWGWIATHTGNPPNFRLSKLRMTRSNSVSGGSAAGDYSSSPGESKSPY